MVVVEEACGVTQCNGLPGDNLMHRSLPSEECHVGVLVECQHVLDGQEVNLFVPSYLQYGCHGQIDYYVQMTQSLVCTWSCGVVERCQETVSCSACYCCFHCFYKQMKNLKEVQVEEGCVFLGGRCYCFPGHGKS